MKLSDTYSALIVLVIIAEIYLKIISKQTQDLCKTQSGSLQNSFKIGATKIKDRCLPLLRSQQQKFKIIANQY